MSKLVRTNVASTKLFKFITLAALGVNLSANAIPTDYKVDFTTNITFPANTEGKVFAPTSNAAHRTLFYTGTKDGQNVSGYFLAKNFLGWTQYSFPVLDAYNTRNKYVVDVTEGPGNKTVVLSYAEGVGQLFSYTSDGRNWNSVRIVSRDVNYNHLTNTDTAGIKTVAAYGNNHNNLLTTLDLGYWQLWALPNPCFGQSNCTFENKFFGSLNDKYALIHNKSTGNYSTNYLATSTNLTEWYRTDLPFGSSVIENVIGRNDLWFAVAKDKDGSRKLWWTPDLSNWGSYKLSYGEVTDAKSFKNKIALLLVSDTTTVTGLSSLGHGDDCPPCPVPDCPAPPECPAPTPCPPCPCEEHHKPQPNEPEHHITTELLVIDTETNTHQVMHKFDGRVTSLTSFDDKLFLAGDFTNDADNKRAALASTNL